MPAPSLHRYANHHGDSGVSAWARHDDALSVEFGGGPVYVYTARQLGRADFRTLCRAAEAGRGLATVIARDIGDRYAARFDDRAAWARAQAPSKR